MVSPSQSSQRLGIGSNVVRSPRIKRRGNRNISFILVLATVSAVALVLYHFSVEKPRDASVSTEGTLNHALVPKLHKASTKSNDIGLPLTALKVARPRPNGGGSGRGRPIVAQDAKALEFLLGRILGERASDHIQFRLGQLRCPNPNIALDPVAASPALGLADDTNVDYSTVIDCYRLLHDKKNRKLVTIWASSTSAASYGLHQLMKEYLNVSVSWGVGLAGGQHLEYPKSLLANPEFEWSPDLLDERYQRVQVAAGRWRYYYNVCTFGYTTPFWDWPEWEKEIDWMALHGINLPLAFIGQEYIWLKLWTNETFGLAEEEVYQDLFSGPAWFPWHWMGNLKVWGGPVDRLWIERRKELQLKILKRMRDLGMSPVLPAFAGHIPQSLLRKFPRLRVRKSVEWMGFNASYSGMLLLDPTDPMFEEIGGTFMRLQSELYGLTDYYNGDTFNEMFPQSFDERYLSAAGSSVLKGIKRGNPQGKWLLQGWLFLHHRHVWTLPRIQSYLSGVKGEVMVLDLAADIKDTWSSTESFAGNDFVWCLLHNFGGRRGLFGNVDHTNRLLLKALQEAQPYLQGVGLTMEATQHNPVVYESITDLFFLESDVTQREDFEVPEGTGEVLSRDLQDWLASYLLSRYGGATFGEGGKGDAVWDLIHSTYSDLFLPGGPYGHYVTCCPTWSIMNVAPTIELPNDYDSQYEPDSTFRALVTWTTAIQQWAMEHPNIPHPLDRSPTLRLDLTDIGRQFFENLFAEYHGLLVGLIKFYRANVALYKTSDVTSVLTTFRAIRNEMMPLFDDVDHLLGFSKDFRFRDIWLDPALKWASTTYPTESLPESLRAFKSSATLDEFIMGFNAKNLITLWGDGVQGYPNYAAKAWSGLYRTIYKRRWNTFLDRIDALYVSKEYGFRPETLNWVINEADYQWCLTQEAPEVPFSLNNTDALPGGRKRIAGAKANGASKNPVGTDESGTALLSLLVELLNRHVPTWREQTGDGSTVAANGAGSPAPDRRLREGLWHKDRRIVESMCLKLGHLPQVTEWCARAPISGDKGKDLSPSDG
jgi:alpha-N-acetylglucosaminidase